jgi:hypothetical protein
MSYHRASLRDENRESRDGAGVGLWRVLGFEHSGSPELSDHAALRILVHAAAERIARSIPAAESTRHRRWTTADGIARSVRTRESHSTRDGHRPNAERDLRIYLAREVLGASLGVLAKEFDLAKSTVRLAHKSGAELARGFARTKLDPRRPTRPADRPFGRNERPW